jgi:hypothetical protein
LIESVLNSVALVEDNEVHGPCDRFEEADVDFREERWNASVQRQRMSEPDRSVHQPAAALVAAAPSRERARIGALVGGRAFSCHSPLQDSLTRGIEMREWPVGIDSVSVEGAKRASKCHRFDTGYGASDAAGAVYGAEPLRQLSGVVHAHLR